MPLCLFFASFSFISFHVIAWTTSPASLASSTLLAGADADNAGDAGDAAQDAKDAKADLGGIGFYATVSPRRQDLVERLGITAWHVAAPPPHNILVREHFLGQVLAIKWGFPLNHNKHKCIFFPIATMFGAITKLGPPAERLE